MSTAMYGDYLTTVNANSLVCLNAAHQGKRYFYFDLKKMTYYPGKFTRETGLLQTGTEWNALALVAPEIKKLTKEQLDKVEIMLPFILENPTQSISLEEVEGIINRQKEIIFQNRATASISKGARGFDSLANLQFVD